MRGDFYGILTGITVWRAEDGNEDFVQKRTLSEYLSEMEGVGSGL
jgi:hypothetical protein